MTEEREGAGGASAEGAVPTPEDLRETERGLEEAALEALALKDDDDDGKDVGGQSGGAGAGAGEEEGDGDGGDAASTLLVEEVARLVEKETKGLQKQSEEAEGTLQDMDVAIKGLRDWQKQRDEEVAKLRQEQQGLLDQLTREHEAASAAKGEGEGELGSNPLMSELLAEIKQAQEKAAASLSSLASSSDAARNLLSEDQLKLLTSASAMSFAGAGAGASPGAGGGKGEGEEASADAILREADELLRSLASEDDGIDKDAKANDAISWSSDLQSVLSKLDMLDSPAATEESTQQQ